jgi:hypothetical protein
MSSNDARAVASFIRWRLKPVRWSAKLLGEALFLPSRILTRPVAARGGDDTVAALEANGYAKVASGFEVPPIDVTALAGRAAGKSFVDVGPDHSSALTEAFVRLMRRPGVQETVLRYFGGRPWLWNVALNYSDVSDRMSDSQLWHFDYGDTRQLHFMVYFTDVGLDCGPFTFIDATTSSKVPRHPVVIERFTDRDLAESYGIDVATRAIRLVGSRGDVYVADPGRVMHQGARCERPRLVMFASFTTPAPMSRGGRSTITRARREALGAALRAPGKPLLGESVFQ